MARIRAGKWLVVVIASVLLAPSCTGTKPPPSPQRPDQTGPRPSTVAKKRVGSGEYQSAINAFHVEYRSRPQDQALVKEYVRSLDGMKETAEKATEKEDFLAAGRIYAVLLRNYSSFNGFGKMLSFDRAHLNERLVFCKESLSTRGFQEYRKGNLTGAIASWEGLLTIDPDNADIKGALRTAKLQKKNMQENASSQ